MGATNFPLVAPPQGGTPALQQPGQPAPMRPDEFAPGSIANVTTFKFKDVAPPTAIYMQRDDVLILYAATNQGADTVVFSGRFLRVPEPTGGQPSDGGVGRHPGGIFERGIIEPFTFRIPATTLPFAQGTLVNLAEGYLLSLTAVSTVAATRGQTFARAVLSRPPQTANLFSQELFSDYPTQTFPVGWPGGRQLYPIEGSGWRTFIIGATPGAGVDWTVTMGQGQRVQVTSLVATFVASAAAASRNVQLIIDDGVNPEYIGTAAVSITAGQTAQVVGTTGSVNIPVIATSLLIPLPPINMLITSWRIRSLTQNIQGGDQWSLIRLSVEQWIDGI